MSKRRKNRTDSKKQYKTYEWRILDNKYKSTVEEFTLGSWEMAYSMQKIHSMSEKWNMGVFVWNLEQKYEAKKMHGDDRFESHKNSYASHRRKK